MVIEMASSLFRYSHKQSDVNKKWTWLAAIVLGMMTLSMISCSVNSDISATPQFIDNEGNTIPGSIATLEEVTLNGVDQWLLIRGKDTSKSVLLFLHGGPGLSNMPFVKLIQTPALEENYIVIQWDQRGTGKSFSEELNNENLKLENFVADINVLTNHLRARFAKDKIFLIGQSWGSDLGFMAIAEHPELYHAYIATGVTPHWNKRQTLSFHWTMQQAQKFNNTYAIEDLKNIQPFNPVDENHLAIKDAWLHKFGGEYHNLAAYKNYIKYIGKGPEYSKHDVGKFFKGLSLAEKTIEAALLRQDINLFKQLPEVKLPIYFLSGRHDQQTPGLLVKEYYDVLKAPKKELIWFENSGHSLIIEEPEKFVTTLIKASKTTLRRSE
jgi:pimeloyl-ACP methyl ester carboxylesterase